MSFDPVSFLMGAKSGGGGGSSVTTLKDTKSTYAIRIGDTVFVRHRANVDLSGQTTEILTGLPAPDVSQSQAWHYPIVINSGTNIMTSGFVEVLSDGSVTVMVVLNGAVQTSGGYTVSFVIMYKAASGS